VGRRHGGPRRERGAALPEYALILAAMATGVVASIEAATDATRDEVGAFEVADGADPWEATIPTTTVVPTSTTTMAPLPTVATTTTTSTTAPATSTTTTSTPSGGETTTTTVATTPTTAVETRITSIFPTTACPSSPCKDSWSTQFKITVQNTAGSAVSDAHVTVQIQQGNGASGTSTKSCTSSVSGICLINVTSIPKNRNTVTLTVTSVTSSPAWSGGSVTTSTATKPA
jgi:hypothetical protein